MIEGEQSSLASLRNSYVRGRDNEWFKKEGWKEGSNENKNENKGNLKKTKMKLMKYEK